jgi:hypothetical protein
VSTIQKTREDEVIDGINSIFKMCKLVGQNLFPRKIMTADYSGAFDIGNPKQLLHAFRKAEFKNCRISAYPTRREDQILIPNLVLLDIDPGVETKIDATKVCNNIIRDIKKKYGFINYMLMHTGNGKHIIIPFGFDRPFERIKEFAMYQDHFISNNNRNANNVISEEFLSFAKKHLSNNKADKGNYPSFRSIMLRVPGSINIKHDINKTVCIEHEWDYELSKIPGFGDLHPKTDFIYDFRHHLNLVVGNYKIKQLQRKGIATIFDNNKPSIIRWIEVLHDTPLLDGRKRIIWLILAPYVINIRNMKLDQAYIWIKQWADKCDKIKELDFSADEHIDYYLNVAENNGHFPPAFSKLDKYGFVIGCGDLLSSYLTRKMQRWKVS